MCGIAGMVRMDETGGADGAEFSQQEARLRAMLGHMRHRGPDGEGITHHGRCDLVHVRLAIIDVLSGQQPMHVPQAGAHGALHLIFNGEIYNHRRLRQQLERLGHRFTSDHSDTEVLLFGYRQWGDQLPKHLHGMYAFAIWDETERRLVLVRDRAGKKPLYLCRRPGGRHEVMFASLIGTLVAGMPAGVEPKINGSALLNYLRLGYAFLPSMVQGIEEVPPAHMVTIDAHGRIDAQRYWQPPPVSKASTAMGAVSAVREVLTESVNRRLEADVPLGCFLSGGVDSSLIAALAQKKLRATGGEALRTFSVAMPELDYDESPYAQQVAHHIGAHHTRLTAEPSRDVLGDLERLIAVSGEPMADSSILPTYWLSQATREHVKVALSGDGGDELWGGYDRYRAMRILSHWDWLLRVTPLGPLGDARPRSFKTRLRRLVESSRFATPNLQYLSMIHLFTDEQIAGLGFTFEHDDWGAAMPGQAGRHLPGNAGVPNWPLDADPVQAAMRWDLLHYLPFVLLRKIDRAAMAVALEVRCPMLDTAVCDLAGHLPTHVLMPMGRSKGLLRRFAADFLPTAIIRRPKRGFALPLGSWFRGHLQAPLRDRLLDGALETLGIPPAVLTRLCDEHSAEQVDHTHRLFALLGLSMWLRWLRQSRPSPSQR
jgi:asparagine synthase (glutamine-hydrolysing)